MFKITILDRFKFRKFLIVDPPTWMFKKYIQENL